MNNKVYLMDNLEFMRGCKDNEFDLAIVDPPYGGNDAINPKSSDSVKKAKRQTYKEFKNVEPIKEYWVELFRISKNQIVWGCNFYTKVNLAGGRLVWDKKGTAFSRAETAYLSMTKSVNIFEYTWNGMLQQKMKNKEKRIHPTQKPADLYKHLLKSYAKPDDKIFDSHVGSGSIRIACHDMGFDFTGCEIDADYHADQEKRFKKHTQQNELFSSEEIQRSIYFGDYVGAR